MVRAKYHIVVIAFIISTACALNGRAEEEKKQSKDLKGVTVEIGCAHCQWSKETGAKKCVVAGKIGEKVYLLKGDAVKKEFKKDCEMNGSEYIIDGKISDDEKSIEVTALTKKKK